MTHAIRSSLSLVLALGALAAGCAYGGGPSGESGDQSPRLPDGADGEAVDAQPIDFQVARLDVGEDQLHFFDFGAGVGVMEVSQSTSYTAMMQEQGGTPLELYLTFATGGIESAPQALIDDHLARTDRPAEMLDVTIEKATSWWIDEPQTCVTYDLHGAAAAVFPEGCHTDSGNGAGSGHAVLRTTALTTVADASLSNQPDNYVYAACATWGNVRHELFVWDIVFGEGKFVDIEAPANRLIGFVFFGDFARELTFRTVTTPLTFGTRYNLESLEFCD